jgi:hypothetical protein
MWTKTSCPPASGWMKPKPLFELNHLTTPICIGCPFQERFCGGSIAVARNRRSGEEITSRRAEGDRGWQDRLAETRSFARRAIFENNKNGPRRIFSCCAFRPFSCDPECAKPALVQHAREGALARPPTLFRITNKKPRRPRRMRGLSLWSSGELQLIASTSVVNERSGRSRGLKISGRAFS